MAYTAEGIASYLKKMNKDYYGNKTWDRMFGDVSLTGQQMLENLKTDFGQATSEAYKVAQANKTALANSNIISGMKSDIIGENELALQEAYNSYLKNFQTGVGSINEQMAQGNASINELLMGQAQNYADYANAHIDYLYDLWDRYGNIEGSAFNDPRFANYMKDVYDDDGNLKVDQKTGAPIRELMVRGELENLIWDAQGNMTSAGKAFFEQMEYDELLRNDSFDTYLRNANPELHEWALSANPYDYAPNVYGESTMAGTFREMTGRMSDDEVFENIDMFLGMTVGTLNKRIGEFENTMNELLDKDMTNSENVQQVVSVLIKTLNDLGLREEFENVYGDINNSVIDIIDKYVEYKEGYEAGKKAVASSISPGGAGTIFNQKYPVDPEIKLQPLADIVIELTDFVRNRQMAYIQNFHDVENSNGAEIMSYDDTIAKAGDGSWYDYLIDDGSTVRFLSSADTVGDWDKEDSVSAHSGENFTVKYNGESYDIAVGREVMDNNTKEQIDAKMRTSIGRGLQSGDMFYDRGKLWVVTNGGQVKTAVKRFGNKSYERLIDILQGVNFPSNYTYIPSGQSYSKSNIVDNKYVNTPTGYTSIPGK